jgi:hypothetical protein
MPRECMRDVSHLDDDDLIRRIGQRRLCSGEGYTKRRGGEGGGTGWSAVEV